MGPGLTTSRSRRLELLYIHDIASNTLKDDFDADMKAIDLRTKLYH